MPLVFVYGTLKRGGSNFRQMAGAKFRGAARTAAGWTLFHLGGYPGLVADAADRDGVTGEIWDVSPELLARLDRFEGVAEKLYAREALVLAEPAGVEAFVYRYLRPIAGCARLGATWPVG